MPSRSTERGGDVDQFLGAEEFGAADDGAMPHPVDNGHRHHGHGPADWPPSAGPVNGRRRLSAGGRPPCGAEHGDTVFGGSPLLSDRKSVV